MEVNAFLDSLAEEMKNEYNRRRTQTAVQRFGRAVSVTSQEQATPSREQEQATPSRE